MEKKIIVGSVLASFAFMPVTQAVVAIADIDGNTVLNSHMSINIPAGAISQTAAVRVKNGGNLSTVVGNPYDLTIHSEDHALGNSVNTGRRRGIVIESGGSMNLQKLKITGHMDHGVNVYNNGTAVIGDHLSIGEDGKIGIGLKTFQGGSITIGNTAQITGMAKAVQAINGTITIGDNAVLKTTAATVYNDDGDNSVLVPVAVQAISYGKINIGKNAVIQSSQDAVEVHTGGKVNIADGAVISAGLNGLVVFHGGKITLGSAVIDAQNGYALKATGLNAAFGTSKITGNGTYHIQGNLYANKDAQINLTMDEHSYLKGTSELVDGGITNLDMTDSRWDVTGTAEVTALRSSDSVIDMTADNKAFSTFTADSLSGNGSFVLDVNGTAVNQNDKILVDDTFSGTQKLKLKEINGRENDYTLGQEAVGTVLASVNVNNGTFTAEDGEGTLYYNRYELDQQASASSGYSTDWYLKGIERIDPEEKPTTGVATIVGAGALAYSTWRDYDQLQQRLGDLRHNGEEVNGAWVRLRGSKLKRGGQFGFQNQATRYELGYDEKMYSTADYDRYGGVAISYSDGNSSYARGDGENKDKAISFYVTQIGTKGHYFDVVAKFDHMDSDFRVVDTNDQTITGDFDGTGVSLSAEYGRKNSLKHAWYIEPQVQMTLGYLGGADYLTSNGISVQQGGIKSAIGRISFNIGRDIDAKTNIYLKADLLHEFGGSYAVTMRDGRGNSIGLDRSYSDTWLEYGIGAAVQTGINNYFYFDLARSTGGDTKKDWQWNIGSRWTF